MLARENDVDCVVDDVEDDVGNVVVLVAVVLAVSLVADVVLVVVATELVRVVVVVVVVEVIVVVAAFTSDRVVMVVVVVVAMAVVVVVAITLVAPVVVAVTMVDVGAVVVVVDVVLATGNLVLAVDAVVARLTLQSARVYPSSQLHQHWLLNANGRPVSLQKFLRVNPEASHSSNGLKRAAATIAFWKHPVSSLTWHGALMDDVFKYHTGSAMFVLFKKMRVYVVPSQFCSGSAFTAVIFAAHHHFPLAHIAATVVPTGRSGALCARTAVLGNTLPSSNPAR